MRLSGRGLDRKVNLRFAALPVQSHAPCGQKCRNEVKVERKALSTIDFKSAKADMRYKNGKDK